MNYAKVIDEIFSQFKGQKFSIRLWDGQEFQYGKGPKNAFTLVFKKEHTVKRLLAQGALGFGESYMDGSLAIEGDIEAYLRMRHQFKHVRRSYHLVRATIHSKIGVLKNRSDQIAYHYDLGNDFFRLFLDKKTMSYSAGRYEKGSETLDAAQLKKIKLVCEWLDLPKDAKILDLGSGWGGFAAYAAQKHGWDITGYTLSREQLKYCRALAARHNTGKQMSFRYKDMLSALPETQYEAVVAIESIEHVGKEHLAQYFSQLYQTLKPGGSLYIQATGQYKQRTVDRWILKYVFPGGYLPSIGEMVDAAAQAGFKIDHLDDDTPDYLLTMTEWVSRLESHRAEIEDMFDEPFYRLWELWMHGAKVAFEVGYMNLFRIQFRKPK